MLDDFNYDRFDEDVQIDETMWSHKDATWYRDPLPRHVNITGR